MKGITKKKAAVKKTVKTAGKTAGRKAAAKDSPTQAEIITKAIIAKKRPVTITTIAEKTNISTAMIRTHLSRIIAQENSPIAKLKEGVSSHDPVYFISRKMLG